jgi:hypothetical protein
VSNEDTPTEIESRYLDPVIVEAALGVLVGGERETVCPARLIPGGLDQARALRESRMFRLAAEMLKASGVPAR